MYMCVYVCVHLCECICVFMCVCTCVNVYVCVHLCECMCVYVCVYMCACVCTCARVCGSRHMPSMVRMPPFPDHMTIGAASPVHANLIIAPDRYIYMDQHQPQSSTTTMIHHLNLHIHLHTITNNKNNTRSHNTQGWAGGSTYTYILKEMRPHLLMEKNPVEKPLIGKNPPYIGEKNL